MLEGLEDTNSLWYRVLLARYSSEGGRLMGAEMLFPYGGVTFML